MFAINTYSGLKKCLVLQHYASSSMALEKLNSVCHISPQQHRFHNLTFLELGKNHCLTLARHERDFHTSCRCPAKNLMKKFINKTKKKLWYETPPQAKPSSQVIALKPQKKQGQEDNMRIRILNSILYKAITDLLTSPEVNAEIYNYGVEISRVSLSADFSCCRVHWKTSGVSEQDGQIQQALDRSGPRIRYLIMTHQTLGGVPPLVFIKDKAYAAMSEIEHLLQKADFGPEDMEGKDGPGEQRAVEAVPLTTPKKPVLFGVDHEALHKQIQEYKLRTKSTVTQTPELKSSDDSPDTPLADLTRQQLEVLAEYRKRRIMEKKKKSRRPIDDDITPKEYLLARHSQGQEGEECEQFHLEDSQIKELMAEENKSS
ncbi:putative ribosome-binding factor A, mitochondrial [Esox lucius]|uniref:Ribosome binding factor A n=1 Tax=Esox lucius TaxID=8010 RepID=A0A6Q2Z5T0_ESOLU|nr:putative ribosome-binding factor A, mitochondrial [Esox lucius]